MGYISNLRQKIGHEPILMCGCGCLIFNEKGEVLLQRRSDDGLWGNLGGALELGETIEEAVKREVYEETNLIIDDLEIFNIYSGESQHHIYPNKDEVYVINIVFKTTSYKGDMKSLDAESLELKFFNLNELPDDITNPFRVVKEDLEKEQKASINRH